MEALLNPMPSLQIANNISVVETSNSITFLPYQDIMVSVISDFRNDVLTYAAMLEIARQEVELLMIAKANNPGKINVERLAPRNIRLAILNKLNRLMA